MQKWHIIERWLHSWSSWGGLSCLKAQSPTPEEKPFTLSLIRLIANPEKFDGHRVRVIGVLGYGGGLDQAACLYFRIARYSQTAVFWLGSPSQAPTATKITLGGIQVASDQEMGA